MDAWPSNTDHAATASEKRKRSKKQSQGILKLSQPYPSLEAGGLAAATLHSINGRLEWSSIKEGRQARQIIPKGQTIKVFPETRPSAVVAPHVSMKQRIEQGAHFLRTHHPDVDIPSELIGDELTEDVHHSKRNVSFDPYRGTTLETIRHADGRGRQFTFIAHPAGLTGSELHLSLFSSGQGGRHNSSMLRPIAQPSVSFETPIRQVKAGVDHTGNTQLLSVRTMASTSIFSVKFKGNQSLQNVAPTITELACIKRSSLGDRPAVDVVLSYQSNATFCINDNGDVFKIDLRNNGSIERSFSAQHSSLPVSHEPFWRIAMNAEDNGCFVASSKTVDHWDLRTRGPTTLHSILNGDNVITAIERQHTDDLIKLSTTEELLWLDKRYLGRPLMGYKHGRSFDRTLQSSTVTVQDLTLTLLTSQKNGLITVYDVGRGSDALLHAYTPAYALTAPLGSATAHEGCHFVSPTETTASGVDLHLFQISNRGGLHQLDCILAPLQEDTASEPVHYLPSVQWSPEVKKMDKLAARMRPEDGPLSRRNGLEVDFSELYQTLFEVGGSVNPLLDEEKPDEIFDTLDKMPSFWQDTNVPIDHMLTSFDVAFRSGNQPSYASRADFLTRSKVNSKRGYRAVIQDRVPLEDVAKGAAWHCDINPFLRHIMPEVPRNPQEVMEHLGSYDLLEGDNRPGPSYRRETEAKEQLTVDLALSTDIFSPKPFSKPSNLSSLDDALETMSRATEAMSLSTTDLPPVQFGYLSPIPKVEPFTRTEGQPTEGQKAGQKMPLGVRLLLKEWDIGTDPDTYSYHDPYGSHISVPPPTQTELRRLYPMAPPASGATPTQIDDSRSQSKSQTQRPPMVVAAPRAIPPPVTGSQPIAPVRRPPLAGFGAQSQDAMLQQYSSQKNPSQDRIDGSQDAMPSTQVVPGPYGGRLTASKKKVVKKRLGGF